jgi:hypothetical protein
MFIVFDMGMLNLVFVFWCGRFEGYLVAVVAPHTSECTP